MKFLLYPFYWFYVLSAKRSRVRQQLKAYALSDLDELRKDIQKRIEPNFSEMTNRADFPKVVFFLSDRLHLYSIDFVSIFRSGPFFYDWIILLGVYLGDLIIQHSIMPAEWTKDAQGLLVVQFHRESGLFQWSPFDLVEGRYFFGEPEDLFLSCAIFTKLKC